MPIKIPTLQERGLPTTTGIGTPPRGAFMDGSGMQKMAEAMSKEALEIKLKDDTNKAREADTWMRETLHEAETQYQQLRGREAYEAYPDLEERFHKIRSEAESRLQTPEQRELFKAQADAYMGNVRNRNSRFAAEQRRAWDVSALEGQIAVNTTELAGSLGDPEQFQLAVGTVFQNLEDLGEIQGKAPDWVTAKKHEALDKTITEQINVLLDTDTVRARQLFEQYGDYMTDGAREKLGAKVSAFANKERAFAIADDIAVRLQDVPADVRHKLALEALREVPAEHRKDVQSQLMFQLQMVDTAERQAREEFENTSWNRLMADVRPENIPPEGMIDPKMRLSMMSFVEKYNKNNGVIYTDRVKFSALQSMAADDPDQFLREFGPNKYRDVLSASDHDRLMGIYSGILAHKAGRGGKEVDAMHENITRRQALGRVWDGLGIVGRMTPKKAEQKAMIDEQFTLFIQDQEREKGRRLTPPEMNEAAGLFLYKVKVEGIFGDSDQSLLNVRIERPDGTPYQLSEKALRAKELREAGIPVTRTNLENALRVADENAAGN